MVKIIPLSNYLKNLPQAKTSPKMFDLGLVERKPAKILDLGLFLGETKTTTPAVAKEGFDIRQLVADIALRIPARAAASITLGVMEELDPSKGGRVFTPTGKIEEILFGHKESILFKGEEVKSVQERSKEVRKSLADFGIDKGGETLSMLAVAGIVGIDLLPFGGAKKGLANALLKANKTEDVLKVLTKAKVPQDVTKLYASKFAKATKLSEIEKGIKSLEGVLKTTKVAPKIAPEAQKATKLGISAEKGIIPQELQPLAQEARKFKSAEEFVEKIKTLKEQVKAGRTWDSGIKTLPKEDRFLAEVAMGEKYQPEISSIFGKKYGYGEKAISDFYTQAVKGVREVAEEVPKITPENTIQKLIKAIDESIPLNVEQKKLYSQEMAKRTARVAAMGEKVAGEKGFFAQLGQLKGELPKKQFEAIRKQFTQKEADLLFNTIEQAKNMLPLEKVATKGGLTKLLEGAVPTKSELELLRGVFPKELVDAVLARRPLFDRIKDVLGEIINIPRTMMATFDLSAPLRQGIFMLGRPIRFVQSFKDMFKFAVSEKAYQGLIEGIKARPTYLKMKQGGLALTEIGGPLLKREEAFMGALAERIPGYGVIIRASNRAYTGFLNKLRADIFDDILKKAKIVGRDIDEPLLKSIGNFVSAGTGRGKFGLLETGIIPKSMEKSAVVLNGVFFSPRLMASRLNLLNPYFYIQMDPLVRKEAIKTLFSTSGILGSIYGLWKLNGGEVGLDPRNADFAKVKIGNTRYDLLGGFQQYIRIAAQLVAGEIISSTTGRTITLGEGYKPLTRKDIALRFFEYKTSPIASFFIALLSGTTAIGEDVDVPTEVINRFIPMAIQDLYDISQEEGAEGILYGLPAIFGVGVQTYGKQELAVGESKLGEPTAQIRPVPELAEKIRELVLGQIKLGPSKGFSVEAYFDQLSDLPREEAADIFDKIAETNPELAKKLSDVVKEREKGITVKDKDLKSKGVASGDRALAIKKELDKLKTKEEKSALWDEYVRKGVITEDVSEQLLKLLNQ